MTTHTGVTGRALTRALQSLSASTTLTVTVMGIRYQGERLCSPFLTHQNVTVGPHRDSPYGVLITNERYTIHVSTHRTSVALRAPAPASGMTWHTAAVPLAAVYAVTARLEAIAPGLTMAIREQLEGTPAGAAPGALATVSVLLPVLLEYDHLGRPVYAEPAPEPAGDVPAGITEAAFSPEDDPPAPAEDAA